MKNTTEESSHKDEEKTVNLGPQCYCKGPFALGRFCYLYERWYYSKHQYLQDSWHLVAVPWGQYRLSKYAAQSCWAHSTVSSDSQPPSQTLTHRIWSWVKPRKVFIKSSLRGFACRSLQSRWQLALCSRKHSISIYTSSWTGNPVLNLGYLHLGINSQSLLFRSPCPKTLPSILCYIHLLGSRVPNHLHDNSSVCLSKVWTRVLQRTVLEIQPKETK